LLCEPDLASVLGKQARARVEEAFRLDKMISAYGELYRELELKN